MLNKICILLLTLYSLSAFAQIKGTILDSITKEPIPYVNIWVQGKNIGTTADTDGNFALPETTDNTGRVIFSAVGYANQHLFLKDIADILYLTPQAIELNEVVVETPKKTNHIIIGSLDDAEKHIFFGMREGQPWINANFYEYKPKYAATPYLNSLKVYIMTETDDATFNVRLYSVGKNGEPGNYVYSENIICHPKRGSKEYNIDLSKLNIRMPDNGIFVALEWLITDNNRYEDIVDVIKANSKSVKKNEIYYKYTPSFAVTYADIDVIAWKYYKGKWTKTKKTKKKADYTGVSGLAMELKLTD